MNFAEAMNEVTGWKRTENGAVARETTGDSLIDLFGVIGAMRERDEMDIQNMFHSAFAEDKLLATKMMFYARNCRGGLGERRTFRVMLHDMAVRHPEIVAANMENIPFYGRWDDLYELIATPAEPAMWHLIRLQWIEDATNMKAGKPISIMAKWLKSVNASSAKTCAYGRKTAKELGLSEKQYRKALSALRNYLKVCEKRMSSNEWKAIEYSEVPSYAMKRYKEAFKRHDIEGFNAYMQTLEKEISKGVVTSVKASTLYPMDLVHEQIKKHRYNVVTEAQWKALPNYVEGEHNVVVMADVSGSMTWEDNEPISASIGLAIYFAERNKGVYANKYMTFTNRPNFISINPNDTLAAKVTQVMNTDVGYSTNLEAAFMRILEVARLNHVPVDEMPKALIVISDMEIDGFCRGRGLDFLQEMERRFKTYGYKMPKVVFWNVEARANTYHAKATNPNVQFVSGYSASSFKDVLKTLDYDAYKAMVETLNNPMYDRVVA